MLAELERLASGIAGTATEHRSPGGRAREDPADDAVADDTEPADAEVDDTEETTVLARDPD